MNELFLAIDVGTQSIRAILFTGEGKIAAQNRQFIESFYSEKPGWAEQNAVFFYDKLCETTQGLFSACPELKKISPDVR